MKAKFLALAALVLGMVSCQNDFDGANVGGGEVPVTLSVALPDDSTRAEAGNDSSKGAIGNIDLNKYDIRYILEVYDENGTLAKERKTNYEKSSTTTSFELRLVPGRDYKFVVWADFVLEGKEEPLHYDATNLAEIKLLGDQLAMDESRDAYTGFTVIDNFSSASTVDIPLTRPFAKLRVVTTDINDLYSKPVSATVNYTSGLYTSFNAIEAKVVNSAVGNITKSVDFAKMKYTTEPKDGKQTLFADYFFGAEDERVLFTLDIEDGTGMDIPTVVFNTNIPVKRNYLTTVQGPIMTDSNNITVHIEDAFANGSDWNPGNDNYDVEVWDGKSLNAPQLDPNDTTNSTYLIKRGSELAWLAAAVNGTLETRAAAPDPFTGKTFKLTADIDLGENAWTPIGKNNSIYFQGIFDGQGHTVKGLKINSYCGHNSHALFGGVAGSTEIRNLVIDGAYIVNPETNEGDFYAAGLIGSFYGSLTVENVTVQNSTFIGNNKAAGLIAHDGANSSLKKIDNCHIYNCTIKTNNEADGGNVGGFMGIFQGDANVDNKISNCSVKKCTIVGINSSNSGKRANSEFIGGTISKANQTLTIENCVVENNNFTQTFVHADGVADYVGSYDNKFIGGDRDEKYLAVVIINGTRYEGLEEPKNVSANGEYYTTISDALENIDSTEVEITLGEGEHVMPNNAKAGKTITFVGVDKETTIIKTGENGTSYHEGCTINYNNVTVTRKAGLPYEEGKMDGFVRAKQENYENCIINGCVRLMVTESATFNNCEFRNTVKSGFDGYSIHYYGYDGSKVTVNDCKFYTRSKAICIYSEGKTKYDLEVNRCEFNSSEVDDKAAIQMHTEYGIYGTVAINESTATNFIAKNNGLWNEIVNSSQNIYGLASQTPTSNFAITIDGTPAQLAGCTLVPGYQALFFDGSSTYYLVNKQSLADFRAFLAANTGRHPYNRTYKLLADIDAEGFVWNSISAIPDGGTFVGLVLDGDNHTITNLTINGEGMFNMSSANSTIKNITIDGATSTSDGHNAAIFWGSVYSSVNFENVHVKNSTITGNCNVGTFVGGTYEPNNLVVKFTDCSVEKCTITANGYEWQDPTGASGFVGKVYASSKVDFEGKNSVDVATTITNNNGLVGGKVYAYTKTENGVWAQTGICDECIDWDGIITPETVADGVTKMGDNTYYISNKAGMLWFANEVNVKGNGFAQKTINLTADIDLENMEWTPIGQTGGYDVATYFKGTFNGNDHTISNLKITTTNPGKSFAAGLFGFIDAGDAMIRNLTINGATVYGHHWTGAITGYLTGEITDCTVINANIVCSHANNDACGDKASTIVGYINSGKINNCHAEDCTVKAGRDAGQLVGCAKTEFIGTGLTATNVTVSANGDCTGNNIRNEIVGRFN